MTTVLTPHAGQGILYSLQTMCEGRSQAVHHCGVAVTATDSHSRQRCPPRQCHGHYDQSAGSPQCTVNRFVSIVVGRRAGRSARRSIAGRGDHQRRRQVALRGADLQTIARREEPYHPHHGSGHRQFTGHFIDKPTAPRSVARQRTTLPSQLWPATWWPTGTPHSGFAGGQTRADRRGGTGDR